MTGRIEHPDFEHVGGVNVYVGKADPPTDEEQAAYEASLAEDQ